MADAVLNASEAEEFHRWQIRVLSRADVDLVSAFTISAVPEAIGIVRAAQMETVSVVISITVETDGRLPSGLPLGEAIEEVDAESDAATASFMVNCSHPSHFAAVLRDAGSWRNRIVGLRTNASRRSHAELDEAESLDSGDPEELGSLHREISTLLPRLAVLVGCCGTDQRHVQAIARATSRCSGKGCSNSESA